MRRIKRAVAALGLVSMMSASMMIAAPAASAAESDASTPVGVYFCPEGWYGVIVGVQTPTGERYFTVCVQA